MQITQHKVVTIDYTLSDANGELIDSSKGSHPLAYIHGIGAMIPGLEQALEGKAPGDHIEVQVQPADAYGDRDPSLVQVVPRSAFGGEAVEVGMHYRASSEQGTRIISVTQIEGDEVTVDGNHPLAGITLNFNVDVVDVRDASAEEIEHGHVHDPSGHEH